VKVTVEKIDDINYIISGNVKNSVIEDKIATLKEEAAKDPEKEASDNEKFDNEAASLVFNDFIEAGIKEANIAVDTLLGQPGLKKYEKHEDSVFFEVYLATSPVIDVNTDLSDIVPSFTKPKADPKAVEAKLEAFAIQQAPFTKISEERAVVEGDIVVIDFEGFIGGEPFEGGSANDFKLTVGAQKFIPGFEEQLVGMEYNKEKTITVTFPTEYQAEDLAGKETQFVIKLHEIQEQKPETVDDAFAQKILSKSTATVATLKEKFADQVISEELSNMYNNDLKPKLLKGLLTKFDFTLPDNIVEQEIDAKVREKLQVLPPMEQKVQMEDKEKFLALRDSVREESRAGIKIALIVEALALKEGIDVDEQEVIAALGYQAMMAGQDAAELVQYYRDNNMMVSAKLGLTEDKLFGQILGFDK
jgi:trigger factor